MVIGAPPGEFPSGNASVYHSGGLYAGPCLRHLIGADDPRFPAQSGDATLVLDLALTPDDFLQWAGRPSSDWWPLLETLRARGLFLRVPLAPKGSTVSAIRKLARMEPKARFLADPFLHGPESNWPAHVRLAETHNIFLTTLGAFAPVQPQNPDWLASGVLTAAMHFVSGEVGAGKLFFASGQPLSSPPGEEHVEKWLTSIGALDKDQQRLVRIDNARELFGR